MNKDRPESYEEGVLRQEIERLAPRLRILQVGNLFGRGLDAIVEDACGQFLWSVYCRTNGPPMAPSSRARRNQQSLF